MSGTGARMGAVVTDSFGVWMWHQVRVSCSFTIANDVPGVLFSVTGSDNLSSARVENMVLLNVWYPRAMAIRSPDDPRSTSLYHAPKHADA